MSSLLLSPESVLNRLLLDGQHVSNQHVITAVITGVLLLNKLLDGQAAVFWVRLSPDITRYH